MAEGFCFQTLQEGSAVQTAFSGYALFELSWFMTHKSRLRRNNPPGRHACPSLSFAWADSFEETILSALDFILAEGLAEGSGKRIRDASIYTSKKYRSSFYS